MKYINSLSIHLFAMISVAVVALSIKDITLSQFALFSFFFGALLFSYMQRTKNMTEEEMMNKLGFRGNKFFDTTIE